MSNKIVLSDLNIQYPSQSDLPKEQGSFILCRLSQFPARDEDRKIIDDEYTSCCFTSAFGKQTSVPLPDGRSLTLAVRKWRRNKDGNIANPTSGDQLTYWFDDTQEELLKYCIAEKILYVYGDTNNPDAPPMFPDDYKKHIMKLNSQTRVIPNNADIDDRISQRLSDG